MYSSPVAGMLHHLKRHSRRIAIGLPIAFLIASTLSLVRDPEEVCVVATDNRYVTVGEQVTLLVTAASDEPVNVIGATVRVPEDTLELVNVSKDDSIIDLWAEEPAVASGTVRFSGGIISRNGFTGTGTVLTLVVRPKMEGVASVSFDEVHMLAHDGTGMEVGCGRNPITLSIRPRTFPTPDVNNDNRVNMFDFGLVSARLFWGYESKYDLNQDGRITFADLGILIANMTRNERLGSLAFLWYR